jgi:hypothetical protein
MKSKSQVRPASQLYDEDFAVWATETARLLRERRFSEIDIEHLAEEIEALGNRDKREVLSRLTVLMQHLLKWQFQAKKRSRSWQATIATERAELGHIFEQSPGLRRGVTTSLAQGYRRAVKLVVIESGLSAKTFPPDCPFTPVQVLDEDFLPER